VQTIVAGHVAPVDVGEVNDRVFLNNSSIGIYPDLVAEREALRTKGYRKWPAFAIAGARLIRRYRGITVRVTSDQETRTFRTPFLFVGNNEYTADGIKLGGRTSLCDGRLFAYVAPRLHGRDLPRLLLSALARGTADGQGLERFSTVALDVETPHARRIRVSLDGEVAIMTTPLHYRIRCAALNVLVPEAGKR
jgi:diacylglycerol kinase family enzyme